MLKKSILIGFLFNSLLFSDTDLQKSLYDSAEEMMGFDEKMNQLIAQHNGLSAEEDKEMRQMTIEDFKETTNGYILEQTIDDNNNTQIELTLKEGMLTIITTKREREKIENEEGTSYETTMSKSATSLYVPHDVKEESLTESYIDGVLKITFLKK